MAGRTLLLLAHVLACLMTLLGATSTADALPKNFRNVDTFYVGALPSKADMEEFRSLGITRIISLHRLKADVAETARGLGLEVHSYPLRTRLIDPEEIMRLIETAPPGSVYVHCLHGADRTGAVTAYWLTTRRGYDPFAALAAVISPKDYHIRGLEMLAREYALSFALDESTIGRYSGAHNGGLEGFKVRGNQWYTRLARHYLELTVGPPLREPSERFWGKHGTGKFD